MFRSFFYLSIIEGLVLRNYEKGDVNTQRIRNVEVFIITIIIIN